MSTALTSDGPFDLRLSVAAAASFFPATERPPMTLRAAVPLGRRTAVVAVSQSTRPPGSLRAFSDTAIGTQRLRAIANWLVSAELDLRPFYAVAAPHPVMGPVVGSLYGLKPLRPATLFEMLVIAITEQQLSLAAAFHIRTRLIKRFGRSVDDVWSFPQPQILAAAPLEELAACGLSRRKAEYLSALARRVASGALNLDALRQESDQRIREALAGNRGFGEWSIDYILNRGFGRCDTLPAGDVGLQRVIGHYIGGLPRLTAAELQSALAPFAPFRGLAAFYLAVHWRMRRGERSDVKTPGGSLGGTVAPASPEVAPTGRPAAATRPRRKTLPPCR